MMTITKILCEEKDPDGDYPNCDFIRGHVSPHSWALDRMVAEGFDDTSAQRPQVVKKDRRMR
jgi:hypothetical protein